MNYGECLRKSEKEGKYLISLSFSDDPESVEIGYIPYKVKSNFTAKRNSAIKRASRASSLRADGLPYTPTPGPIPYDSASHSIINVGCPGLAVMAKLFLIRTVLKWKTKGYESY